MYIYNLYAVALCLGCASHCLMCDAVACLMCEEDYIPNGVDCTGEKFPFLVNM